MCANINRIIQMQSEPRLSGSGRLFGISKQIPSVSQKKKGYKSKGLKSYSHQLIKVIVVSIYIFCFAKKKSKKKGINFMIKQISFRIGFSD